MKMLFLNDTYLFKCSAQVTEVGENELGKWLTLTQTVFYPQGGGQPADSGQIELENGKKLEITKVRLIDGSIYHFFAEKTPVMVGEKVLCHIDKNLRMTHAACHTAGHLISHIIEKNHPQVRASKAYHFMDGPYVEFVGSDLPDLSSSQDELKEFIQKSTSVRAFVEENKTQDTVHGAKLFRLIQIGDFTPTPCGGTHLKSLDELESVEMTKIKKTKEGFRISYTFKYKHV